MGGNPATHFFFALSAGQRPIRLRASEMPRSEQWQPFASEQATYWPNHSCHVSLARSVSDFEAWCGGWLATAGSPVAAGLPSADGSPTVRTTDDVVAGGPTTPEFAGSAVTAVEGGGWIVAVVVTAGGDLGGEADIS